MKSSSNEELWSSFAFTNRSLVAAATAFHFDNVASAAITATITVVAAGL